MSQKSSSLPSPSRVVAASPKGALRRGLIALALTLGTACGGDDAPPSCFDAVSHYYNSGCYYFYLDTGDVVPSSTLVQDCRDIRLIDGSSCQGAVDDWLICLGDVPSNSTTDADCNCSAPQERMLQACL